MSRKTSQRKHKAARSRARAEQAAEASAAPGKHAHAATTPARHGPRPAWPWSRQALLGLSVLGMVLAGYLALTSWQGSVLAYCGPGSGCDIVQSSRWATLLGAPTAFWGFLTYLALAGVALRLRNPGRRWRWATLVAVPALLFSLYLTGISLGVLHASCKYCLGSLGLLVAIVAVLAIDRPQHLTVRAWSSWLVQAAALGAVLVVAGQLYFSGTIDSGVGPEDPYLRGLAEHLKESGALFYGAYWCPHCADQKAMFGAAAKRLPYVECAPNGPQGAANPVCIAAGVDSFPTWVIEGERSSGELTPAVLAQRSHYPPPGSPAPGKG